MKPLIRIFVMFVLTGCICQLAFLGMASGLKKYSNHHTERLTEIFEHSTYFDILFIGSSRTHVTIQPRMIDSICKVNCYNAGAEGANLLEFKMNLDGFLQNHPNPKMVVLTIDLHSFDLHPYGQGRIFIPNLYYPFLQNKALDSSLNQQDVHTIVFKWLPFVQLSDWNDAEKMHGLKCFLGSKQKQVAGKQEFQDKGYLSNSLQSMTGADTVKTYEHFDIANEAIVCLKSIIQNCENRKIKLLFTYAPEYNFNRERHVTNASAILDTITTIANDNHIPYCRDDSLLMCSNAFYFKNVGHLNTNGAHVYSIVLAKKINEIGIDFIKK